MINDAFVFAALLIILVPGTGVIYTISTGMKEGKSKSVFAAIGCTLGILPHLLISSSLSAMLLQINNTVLITIRWLGAIYLLYLGLAMVLTKNKVELGYDNLQTNNWVIIRQGILINLLNPKLTMFFFSFLPQYLDSERGNYIGQFFLLGCIFMLLTLMVFIAYGVLAGMAKGIVVRGSAGINILQKGFGLIFIGFALKLAFNS